MSDHFTPAALLFKISEAKREAKKECCAYGCKNTPNERKKWLTNDFGKCHKYKMIPVSDLVKERNKLLISKEDPEKLEYLTERIKYFNAGVL